MIKKPKTTIKLRLYSTAIGIFFILIVIGLITNFYVKHAFNYQSLLSVTNVISKLELQLRKDEKDFLLRETINPRFFETKESDYIDSFEDNIKKVQKLIRNLQQNKFIQNLNLVNDLKKLNQHFSDYHATFLEMEGIILEKGFKDYGLVGDMREQIHNVEDMIARMPDNKQMNVHMLMLRRHEKDYLLRKDLKYKKKFDDRITLFITYLQTKNQGKIDKKHARLIRYLKSYRHYFSQVIEHDVIIGLDEKQGLTKDLNRESDAIEQNLFEIKSIIDEKSNQKINQAITTLFIVSFILSIGIVLILMNVSNHILKYLRFLKKYIFRLGDGELPDEITPKKQDEIAEMIHSVNCLLRNLKNTREFAIEVGEGKLDTKINVFGNEGDLGGALVDMRNRLAQVAREREQNVIEAKRRNWISEGIAEFAEILRQNNDNMNEFAYSVLTKLISYLKVNQGGFYIINDDDPDNPFYELKAAVAYGRRKFLKKKVVIGEDLVGQVIREKRTIYMTEIPDDYINITSGLGDANPRSLLIAPLMLHEQVLGVVELAAFHELEEYKMSFLDRVGKDIATTISTVKINQRTKKLLEQSQEQGEKMKEQEEELRQNIEELEAIQEESDRKTAEISGIIGALHTTFMVVEYDLKGEILDVNEAFLKFFGLQRHEFIGKNHADFTVRNRDSDEYQQFWENLKNGKVVKDIKHVHMHGHEYWLQQTYTPIYNKEGRPPYKVINIALDISEQKRQEQKIIEQAKELSSQEEEMRQNMEELMTIQEECERKEKTLSKQLEKARNEIERLKGKD